MRACERPNAQIICERPGECGTAVSQVGSVSFVEQRSSCNGILPECRYTLPAVTQEIYVHKCGEQERHFLWRIKSMADKEAT